MSQITELLIDFLIGETATVLLFVTACCALYVAKGLRR